ncbi:MAG: MurR/RpiR family transcriptional regulator [Clostridiales bacterium]|nr:MurR/RpiR family transcriptional regulator [Clostridiales bacterium]
MFTIKQIQSLNELEMEVYQYIIQHQNAIPYMRIRELAAEAHVSTTTILRFCRKIGCDGYAEFKLRMKEFVGQQHELIVPEDLSELRAFLTRMEAPAFQAKLDEAAAVIAKADQILCIGICNSGYIAQYAARYFTTFGKFSLAVTDPFYPVKQFSNSTNTVAMVFSVSGESEQAVQLTHYLKQRSCQIISITHTENSTIAQLSDLTLSYYITMRRDADYVDFTSQAPAVILCESLARRVGGRLTETE